MEGTMVPYNYLTCLTCHVAFKEPELQREHYKSDWHRYNLKRKVSILPPISAEEFQQKVNNQRNIEEMQSQEKSEYCHICRKTFGGQNAFDNHLNSKKHKDNGKKHVEHSNHMSERKTADSDIEELDSDEWNDGTENPINNNDCIFCLHHSKHFIKNLEHMTIVHSFFIPDIEYCTDLYGLLEYLGEKVSNDFVCLWCNERGRTFYSADAARKHMMDKGHCKVLHEGEALIEYTDFYDYSSSYPDNDNECDPEEEVTIPELDNSEYQLVLPSGLTVGHRNLMRYYKQRINPHSIVVSSSSTGKIHKVLACYRSLGWTETQYEVVIKKARDIHYMKRMQSKFKLKLGVKGNKLQKHFRAQVNF